MDRKELRDLALASGFKLKEQPDGSVDLNPYVYEFAESCLLPYKDKIDRLCSAGDSAANLLGFLSHHFRGKLSDDSLMDMAEKADELSAAIVSTLELNDNDARKQIIDENLELKARVAHLESKIFDQESFRKLPIKVLNVLFSEIKYQDDKWGFEHNRNQTIEGHLLILRKELIEAEDGWMKNLTGRNSVESELVQVAAVAIQALINLDNAGRL